MTEIMYHPEDVGKSVLNSHGKISKIRKYHMTEKEFDRYRKKWEGSIKEVDNKIKKMAHKHFFNPYRQGIYYYQVQSMYLLGCNKWHKLNTILSKMQEIMSSIEFRKNGILTNKWEAYTGKSNKDHAIRCKDYIGRIQENMIFFQRLSKLHPTGYKLHQVKASVDSKRVTKVGFPSGCYSYRLSTYGTMKEALPLRDFRKFIFPKHESKYISYKFIGTVITANKIIVEGVVHEVS